MLKSKENLTIDESQVFFTIDESEIFECISELMIKNKIVMFQNKQKCCYKEYNYDIEDTEYYKINFLNNNKCFKFKN